MSCPFQFLVLQSYTFIHYVENIKGATHLCYNSTKKYSLDSRVPKQLLHPHLPVQCFSRWRHRCILPVYSDYESIVRCILGKNFLPFCNLSLQSSDYLLCRSFLVWYSPICQLFLLIAKLLEFHLESYCLCLYVLMFSLLFSVIVS
jgi:hypothetical protein